MNSGFNDQANFIRFSFFLDYEWGHVLITKLLQSARNGVIPTVKELSETFDA